MEYEKGKSVKNLNSNNHRSSKHSEKSNTGGANLDDNELYEELSQRLEPLLEFFSSLPFEQARMCILYTILCSIRLLSPIDALGVMERTKHLYLTTEDPSQEERLPHFVV